MPYLARDPDKAPVASLMRAAEELADRAEARISDIRQQSDWTKAAITNNWTMV
jgi:hypothetical protein